MAFWVNYIIRTALILEVSGFLATSADSRPLRLEAPMETAANSG